MASTEDLDALVGLVERYRWRLVCVGDPAQLPAVGRGGMFALWCERLAPHRLEEVRRFADDWQATASLALRRGKPAAAQAYATHHRLQSVHPALVADRVSRQFERLSARGATVAITTASAGTARAVNLAIQHRRNPRRVGDWAELADGTGAFVGDRVATRRNVAWSPRRDRRSATAKAGRSPRWARTARCRWPTLTGGQSGCRLPTLPGTWSWAGPSPATGARA